MTAFANLLCVILLSLVFPIAKGSSCSGNSVNVTVVSGSGDDNLVFWELQKTGETSYSGSVGSTVTCLEGGAYNLLGSPGGNTLGWEGAKLSMVDLQDGNVYLNAWEGPTNDEDRNKEVLIPCEVGKQWDSSSLSCVSCTTGRFGISKGDCSYTAEN